MKTQIQALKAEFLKNKYSSILWITFIAFAIAPIMGGVFLLITQSPEALSNTGAVSEKIKFMEFSANWNSFLGLLTQAIGIGGILIFGFVASWTFGREYSDGTAKDLLSLPVSRTKILNAKFIIYVLWSLMLVISNLLIGLLIGTALRLPFSEMSNFGGFLTHYFATTILTILIGTPIAFFAIWGKGYLAPLGFVAITLVLAQIIGATGYGTYFPWSIPGLFSGIANDSKEQLDIISYLILITISVTGYILTIWYWNKADQVK